MRNKPNKSRRDAPIKDTANELPFDAVSKPAPRRYSNNEIPDETMTDKPRRRYVPKGQGKKIRMPNRFEGEATDYDIINDLENTKANITVGQILKMSHKESSKLMQALRHKMVDREGTPQ